MSDRELDVQMAELMGWHYWDFKGDYDGEYPMYIVLDALLIVYDVADKHREFSPSTDIAAAMLVVEVLMENWLPALYHDGQLWVCELRDGENKIVRSATTLPEAICLAARAAVEGGR